MKPLRVAAFTGGKDISAARFRLRQYLPALSQALIAVDEFYSHLGSWPPNSKLKRPFWLVGTVAERIPAVLKSHHYDLTFLQRELVSTLSTLERWTKRPRVFDVDDAVWLNRGGRTGFKSILQMCDGVICGNDFIAEAARRWNSNICIIPTAVDTDRFVPALAPSAAARQRQLIIGWSGLAVGLQNVYLIEETIAQVMAKYPEAVFRVVSEAPPKFRLLSPAQVEYVSWSPESEVRAIQEMTVGIMPLTDSLWSRGKCSYKMLLYMSCAVPVVVSPVGMNAQVLSQGKVGLGARDPAEWAEALTLLLQNRALADEMGTAGRCVIEQHYALRKLAPRLASFLRAVAG
jgi:glycosyltransferase involved in cell wall biosynthesis